MKTILIAGGTGFIGRKIQTILENKGYRTAILSRNPKKENEYYWNPTKKEIDKNAFKSVNGIINLCGASIGDVRWSANRKKELLTSRIEPTKFLYSFIDELEQLEVYITASGINCYDFNEVSKTFEEKDAFGSDFLSQLVKEWENTADLFSSHCRVVKMRTAVVLDRKEGALSKMSLPIQLGIGSPLGTGKQIISWVHINDVTNAYIHAIEKPLNGAYNLVGGNETNEIFLKLLAKTLNKPFWFPKVPTFVLELTLGEMAVIILKGVKASNQKLIESGFEFQFLEVEEAFKNSYQKA